MPGRLQVATGGALYADNTVQLAAPYVALGQAFQPPVLAGQEPLIFTQTDATGVTTALALAPTFGPGSLIVRADLIDIGNLSLQGIGSARFHAPRGDIRGNGTLSMAGDLVFEAGQIYPTTLGKFNIFVSRLRSRHRDRARLDHHSRRTVARTAAVRWRHALALRIKYPPGRHAACAHWRDQSRLERQRHRTSRPDRRCGTAQSGHVSIDLGRRQSDLRFRG